MYSTDIIVTLLLRGDVTTHSSQGHEYSQMFEQFNICVTSLVMGQNSQVPPPAPRPTAPPLRYFPLWVNTTQLGNYDN